MKSALGVLGETRPGTVSLSLNPFAHFILIHTILRNMYAPQTDSASALSGDAAARTSVSVVDNEDSPCFGMQYALHNWLQSWLNSPESMQMDNNKRTEEPPLVHDALPFYWLAQISLLAAQDNGNTNGSGPIFGDSMSERGGRFRLLKAWLDHIRVFLRSENPVPTHLWDELVKIQMNMSMDNGRAGDEHALGLLAHFPGN